jgi:hypothetical protein
VNLVEGGEVPTADRELHGINKSQSPMIDDSESIRHDQTAEPHPRDRVALIYVTWILLGTIYTYGVIAAHNVQIRSSCWGNEARRRMFPWTAAFMRLW